VVTTATKLGGRNTWESEHTRTGLPLEEDVLAILGWGKASDWGEGGAKIAVIGIARHDGLRRTNIFVSAAQNFGRPFV